jgi:hypothetical protein
MAIVLNDNFRIFAPKPADDRYLNNGLVYTSVSEVNTTITSSQRYIGLTVLIQGETKPDEFWYNEGISDHHLVLKTNNSTGNLSEITAGDLLPLFTTTVTNGESSHISFSLSQQSGNLIFASPDGESGTPSFRALTPDDIPAISIIEKTQGTLPVDRGGTGTFSLTGVVFGTGTNTLSGVSATAGNQLLRRSIDDTAFEFFTHDFVSEAPVDAFYYLRHNAGWSPIDLSALATAPTYVAPTANLTNVTQTVEFGSNVSLPTLNITFTQNDAGAVTGYELRKNAAVLTTTQNSSDTISNIQATVNYVGRVFHQEGVTKNNNLGTPSPNGKILAGSVDTPTRTVTPRLKQFFGAVADFPTNSAQVRALSNDNFDNVNSFTFLFSNIRAVIAIPNTKNLFRALTSNNETITDAFTMETMQVADAGGTLRTYKIYKYQSVVPLDVNVTITLN